MDWSGNPLSPALPAASTATAAAAASSMPLNIVIMVVAAVGGAVALTAAGDRPFPPLSSLLSLTRCLVRSLSACVVLSFV